MLASLLVCLLGTGLWQTSEGLWIHAKARLAQFLLERAWTRAVADDQAPKPWPWADTRPVARLRVSRYGIDLIVLANASGRTLAFGPAYLSSSTPPGGRGTTILTGHRDTHFAFLRRVQPTDEILMETPDRRQHRYIVRDTSIVDGTTAVIGSDGMPRLALVTCYPFDAIVPGGPLRFVVIADLAGC
jgi:sortase A